MIQFSHRQRPETLVPRLKALYKAISIQSIIAHYLRVFTNLPKCHTLRTSTYAQRSHLHNFLYLPQRLASMTSNAQRSNLKNFFACLKVTLAELHHSPQGLNVHQKIPKTCGWSIVSYHPSHISTQFCVQLPSPCKINALDSQPT